MARPGKLTGGSQRSSGAGEGERERGYDWFRVWGRGFRVIGTERERERARERERESERARAKERAKERARARERERDEKKA